MSGERFPFVLVLALLVLAGAGEAARGLPLGEATLLQEPFECDGAECYRLEVDCPRVAEGAVALVKIETPATPHRGTILFLSGGAGRSRWEDFGRHARKTLRKLGKRGFRRVQVQWESGWLFAAEGRREGQDRLACRPATVARWIYDNLHDPEPAAAFCATGNSGGSAQVAYMLSHYGLDSILSMALPTSGPPMGRVDLGCLPEPGGERRILYSASAADLIDRGFGFKERGAGPCARRDDSFRGLFRRASLSWGDNDYTHPATMVWMLFGEDDGGSAVPQGLTYFDRLQASGTPWLGLSVVEATPHQAPGSRKGARQIRKLLNRECRPRTAPGDSG